MTKEMGALMMCSPGKMIRKLCATDKKSHRLCTKRKSEHNYLQCCKSESNAFLFIPVCNDFKFLAIFVPTTLVGLSWRLDRHPWTPTFFCCRNVLEHCFTWQKLYQGLPFSSEQMKTSWSITGTATGMWKLQTNLKTSACRDMSVF